MKQFSVWMVIVALVGMAALAAQVLAPQEGSAPKQEGSAPKGMMMGEEAGMMMGMSDTMEMHHTMLMNARLSPRDPQAILALRGRLRLSEKQIAELQEIIAKARSQARHLLTDSQARTLMELPEREMSMMHFRQEMMKQQKTGMEGSAPKEGSAMKPEGSQKRGD